MSEVKRIRRSRFQVIVMIMQTLCAVGIFLGLGVALGVQAHPHVDNHGSLELTGARGGRIDFSIDAGRSINGRWAVPGGIQVRLKNESVNYFQELKALKPTASGWYDDLTSVNDQSRAPTTIELSFTLPDDIPGPAEQTLQGEIANYIVVPALVSADRVDVTDREVAISLKIHLIPTGPAPDYIRIYAAPFGFTLAVLSLATLFAVTIIGGKWAPRMGIPDIEVLKAISDENGLMRALRHKDASVRRSAALALGEMRIYAASRSLIDALHDPENEVRVAAVRALEKIRDSRAIEALSIVAATDNDTAVRKAATAALMSPPKRDNPLSQASPTTKPVE